MRLCARAGANFLRRRRQARQHFRPVVGQVAAGADSERKRGFEGEGEGGRARERGTGTGNEGDRKGVEGETGIVNAGVREKEREGEIELVRDGGKEGGKEGGVVREREFACETQNCT